jgi:hypothetical protein
MRLIVAILAAACGTRPARAPTTPSPALMEARRQAEFEAARSAEERRAAERAELARLARDLQEAGLALDAVRPCIDPGYLTEVETVLGLVQRSVNANETELAPDLRALFDAYVPFPDASLQACQQENRGMP